MKKNTFLLIFFFTCISIAHAADYTKEQLIDFALKYVRMESHYKDAEYSTDDADTYNTTLDALEGFPGTYDRLYDLLAAQKEGFVDTSKNYGGFDAGGTSQDPVIWKIKPGETMKFTGRMTVPSSRKVVFLAAGAKIYLSNAAYFALQNSNLCILGKEGQPAEVYGNEDSYRNSSSSSPLIIYGGCLHLLYTKIHKFRFKDNSGSIIAMSCSQPYHTVQKRLFMAHSELSDCKSSGNVRAFIHDGGSAARSGNYLKSRMYFYDCTFRNNINDPEGTTSHYLSTGVIGDHHESAAPYRVMKCLFENNQSGGLAGGAISWNGQDTKPAKIIDCTFRNNKTRRRDEDSYRTYGGAVSCRAPMHIRRCTFIGNNARDGGGAIVVHCPSSGKCGKEVYNLVNSKGAIVPLDLDNETRFEDNYTAGTGGAILCMAETAIFTDGSMTDLSTGSYREPVLKADLRVTIDGSKFIGNKAAIGGGAIAMVLDYGTSGDKKRLDYQTGITIKGNAEIRDNVCSGEGGTVEGDGGAFYMSAINGCDSHSNEGIKVLNEGGTPTITGNRAKCGGAFYQHTTKGDFFVNGGNIAANTATEKGGAIFLDEGTFSMTNGNIQRNSAVNGGGIYIEKGTQMTFSDGLITHNTATERGGGIYLGEGSAESSTSMTLGGSELGIYSNTADYCADDVYADGTYTSLTVPDISTMALRGFIGNATGLNWYKDFNTERYRDTRNEANIYPIPEGGKTITENIALTMGYKGVDLIIRQMGVNEGETIIYTVKDQEDLSKILYRVALSGVSQQSVRGLPMKKYVVAPTNWSWAYQSLSGKTQHLQDNNVFEFEAVHKTDDASAGAPMHNEISETNELNGTSH